MTENGKGIVDIGRLILAFAKVNRATTMEDGVTPESDTDHTVMLSVVASAFAKKLYPDSLDVGRVAEFAIVHDLVEAYACDTDSFGISAEAKRAKDEREREAYLRIEREFRDTFPWIPETIAAYERLDSREARFVKTADKLLSKVTHILNGGAYFKSRGMDEETMWNNYQQMVRAAEEKYGAEFPEVLALMDELIREAKRIAYGA
ncbi:MAG TPA: HD domain-containing protein [Candidatus Paceibacterota bacterium]|nr:HD domain-containing protein [Candidatus Paceibacterota bacterium]